MVDRLAALMAHFPLRVPAFVAGLPDDSRAREGADTHGLLSLIRAGAVEVRHGEESLRIARPSVLLFPRPLDHRLVATPEAEANMVSARLSFAGGASNSVAQALPAVVCLPLDGTWVDEAVLSLLFDEVFAQRCGRVALVERLFEVVMIQVLRQLMESGDVKAGMLSGLSHPRLRNAMVAMHEAPAKDWTLAALADAAGMSRSVFATAFRETVGITPGQYLQGWRVRLAQEALQQGHPLKRIAADVGYGSEAALSRAFKAQAGQSPRAWKSRLSGAIA